MNVTLKVAEESDAPTIADIHMAAFGNNSMLQAMFPTETARRGLWTTLVDRVTCEMRHAKWRILVARNEEDQTVGFAKWCLPISISELYEEPPWNWPEETNIAVLAEWAARVEAANAKLVGDTPCYRLSFLATDPRYQRQGVASKLVKWGVEQAKIDNTPVVLESTVDATAFYERLGFQPDEAIKMRLDHVGPAKSSVIYEERCFIFRPTP